MAFERKHKGATEFLRASKRAAVRPATSHAFGSGIDEDNTVALDSAVMNALFKTEGTAQDIASAIDAPLSSVESAIERLLEQGFIEQPARDQPCKLTEAGQRYLRYSQLTKF